MASFLMSKLLANNISEISKACCWVTVSFQCVRKRSRVTDREEAVANSDVLVDVGVVEARLKVHPVTAAAARVRGVCRRSSCGVQVDVELDGNCGRSWRIERPVGGEDDELN